MLGSGAFGEVYLAEADACIITDNSAVTTRHRLSNNNKRESRRGSTISAKGPIKVAVKTLKGKKKHIQKLARGFEWSLQVHQTLQNKGLRKFLRYSCSYII